MLRGVCSVLVECAVRGVALVQVELVDLVTTDGHYEYVETANEV